MKAYKLYRLLFLLFLTASFCGCNLVHEFPDGNAVDPSLIDVDLSLSINMQFSSDTTFLTYASTLSGDYDIRYIVDIYEAAADSASANYDVNNRIRRIVRTESDVVTDGVYDFGDTLKLQAKKYQLFAWIDFVAKGTNTDMYYDTNDLQQVSVILQNGRYEGYTTTRDAFSSKAEVDLTPYKGQRYVHYQALMNMIRPFAVYQIITTDIEQYATYHQSSTYATPIPASTNVSYNIYFPMGYNTFLDLPENFQSGISYPYDVTDVVPGKEAIIASDYVFVGNDVFYQINFDILDSNGAHINTVNNLRVDLKQNHVTVIRGEFLTKDVNNNSGIGIDDGFAGEIIVPI
ncbi:MAG: hypothetical protein FWD60_11510 [Candidatus Azobacteroides sp.]|nr:hypothetical protein [Candidatus Azobacteroides sp.]